MADVKPLKDANTEPDKEVVEVLEHALKEARAGRLRSVCLVGELTGHATFTSSAIHDTIVHMGLLAFLQHKLADRMLENVQ